MSPGKVGVRGETPSMRARMKVFASKSRMNMNGFRRGGPALSPWKTLGPTLSCAPGLGVWDFGIARVRARVLGPVSPSSGSVADLATNSENSALFKGVEPIGEWRTAVRAGFYLE